MGLVVCLFLIVKAGMQWTTAEKDKDKRTRAKRRILWSLVGLIAAFVIYFILSVIKSFFGVDPPEPFRLP